MVTIEILKLFDCTGARGASRACCFRATRSSTSAFLCSKNNNKKERDYFAFLLFFLRVDFALSPLFLLSPLDLLLLGVERRLFLPLLPLSASLASLASPSSPDSAANLLLLALALALALVLVLVVAVALVALVLELLALALGGAGAAEPGLGEAPTDSRVERALATLAGWSSTSV